MPDLFDQTNINGMTLTNRFMRSATWEGMANEDGTVTPRLIDLMVQLAKGGVGLIITGIAAVHEDGQTDPRTLGIYSDDHVIGLTKMVDAVHQAYGKVVVQIAHGGAHSNPQLIRVQPMGPSVMTVEDGPLCRAMTQDDIHNVIQAFQAAALRAKQAGFDGVQLHGAHGFLLSQFLSPFYNKRTDAYGGSDENRARIVLEVLHQVRQVVGEDYPVMIKINATDYMDDGIQVNDMVRTATLLEGSGIDNIELSGGTAWASRIWNDDNRYCVRTVKEEAYYRDAAKRYKKTVCVPLTLTGGIRSYEVAERLVKENVADYIGLCRPLIREPDLINRWKAGERTRSACVSENACLTVTANGLDLHCVHIK